LLLTPPKHSTATPLAAAPVHIELEPTAKK